MFLGSSGMSFLAIQSRSPKPRSWTSPKAPQLPSPPQFHGGSRLSWLPPPHSEMHVCRLQQPGPFLPPPHQLLSPPFNYFPRFLRPLSCLPCTEHPRLTARCGGEALTSTAVPHLALLSLSLSPFPIPLPQHSLAEGAHGPFPCAQNSDTQAPTSPWI